MNSQSLIVISRLNCAVEEAFNGPERDFLTVKSVREQVERELELVKGFLRTGDWKKVSKATIEARVKQLLRAEEQESDSISHTSKFLPLGEIPADNHIDRSPKFAKPSRKRLKKQPSTQNGDISFEATEKTHKASASQENDTTTRFASISEGQLESSYNPLSSNIMNPQNNCMNMNGRPSLPAPKNISEFDEKELIDSTPSKKADSEPHFSLFQSVDVSTAKDSTSIPTYITETAEKDNGTKLKSVEVEDNLDSDISSVLDRPKKTRKKKAYSSTKGQSPKAKRSCQQKNSITSDQAKIKILQTHLRKCGLRTIWHFELKKFGEDNRAKICHLQKVLRDVGMKGRFSEAKAREIKESRELMADLEAVKEGDKIWGVNNVNDGLGRNTTKKRNSDVALKGEICVPKNIKRPNKRNKGLRKKSTSSRIPHTPNALDWLEDQKDSDQ